MKKIKKKINKTSMLIWENNPLTFNFWLQALELQLVFTHLFLKLVCILLMYF